ncbi:hypothetical protein CLD22_22695 [Rubrivivax gelatinosus]|nr:hypothetical protein [Rubrivivax gelatinosus]
MTRRGSRALAWLAGLALLFAALAPAVSHALAAERGPGWTQVCSAHDAGGPRPDDDAAARLAAATHCPCCSAELPTPGLPPAERGELPAPTAASAAFLVTDDTPPRAAHRLHASARAPPLPAA